MLPLKATTREVVPETLELSQANDKIRQITREAVSEEPLPAEAAIYTDGQANIHRALAILRADLKVVQESIQALELIAAEGRTGRPVTAPMRKPRKVVDIHTKRA